MTYQPGVYILASRRRGTLYTGVTSNLVKRVWQDREALAAGFTQKYDVKTLVYFELCEDITAAIQRETQLKNWKRGWKIALIETDNPEWRDLWPDICG